MPRVRQRRGHELRDRFPLTPAEELAAGIDPSAYSPGLARINALLAVRELDGGDPDAALRRLERARFHELIHVRNHQEAA